MQAHRGSWVLPFGMDADVQTFLGQLPPYVGEAPDPVLAW